MNDVPTKYSAMTRDWLWPDRYDWSCVLMGMNGKVTRSFRVTNEATMEDVVEIMKRFIELNPGWTLVTIQMLVIDLNNPLGMTEDDQPSK